MARGPREIIGRSIGDTRRPPTKKTFGTVEVDHTWPGGAPERLNIVVDYINLLQLKASIDAAVNEIHRYDRRHLSGRKAGIGLNYERRLNGAGRLSVVPARLWILTLALGRMTDPGPQGRAPRPLSVAFQGEAPHVSGEAGQLAG